MVRYFFAVWLLVIAYVLIGNFLYFRRVLPFLRRHDPTANPSFSPGRQFAQIDEYVASLAAEPVRPWFFSYLRHLKAISVVLLVLMAPLLVAALRDAF